MGGVKTTHVSGCAPIFVEMSQIGAATSRRKSTLNHRDPCGRHLFDPGWLNKAREGDRECCRSL